MKELSIEEKAKRYDEAIKQLRAMMPNWENLSYNGKTFLQDLVHIIPELKESEDEQHRKWILEYLYDGLRKTDEQFKEQFKTAIAWLEKQGEPKHICKLDNSYTCVKFPFKAKVKSSGTIVTIHGGQLSLDGKEWVKYQSDNKDGYKIYEPNNLELVCEIEQKPAWGEEDENIIRLSIENLTELEDRYGKEYGQVGDCIDWLESLRPQSQWRPSDEQMDALETAVSSLQSTALESLYQDLKRL